MYKGIMKLFISLFLLSIFCTSYAQVKEKLKAGIYYIKQKGIKLKVKKENRFYCIDKQPAVIFNQYTKFQIDMDQFNKPALYFQLDTLGTKRFFEATKKYIGKELAIVVDGEIISYPRVMQPIKGGKAMISGLTTQELEEIKVKIENQIKL